MEGAAPSGFMTPLVVTDKTSDQWGRGSRGEFRASAEYATNFESLTSLLLWLVSFYGGNAKTTVLCEVVGDDVVQRRDADGIFRRTMRELGEPLCVAVSCERARLGGWPAVDSCLGLTGSAGGSRAYGSVVGVRPRAVITSLVAMAPCNAVRRMVGPFAQCR